MSRDEVRPSSPRQKMNEIMSSNYNVVVWEYECGGLWLPHSSGVTRVLERAYAKRLTRVVLADADPNLGGVSVNLRTLKQTSENPDGATSVCAVRRSEYSGTSPAGTGAMWMWTVDNNHREPMPMEMQCALEAGGSEHGRAISGWSVGPWGAVRGDTWRGVCRGGSAPYPRAPPLLPSTHGHTARPNQIPQQHTGSSVHSMQSIKSIHSNKSTHSNNSTHSNQSTHSANTMRSTQSQKEIKSQRSASPKEKKHNFARQILNNLNPFSSHSSSCERWSETEWSGEERGRRHSLDTVSTYLSHESNQHLSVGSLLNVSGGSDDVFTDGGGGDGTAALPTPNHNIVPVIPAKVSSAGCVVCGVEGGALVSIPACGHLLHVNCLQRHLHGLTNQSVAISCPVCGCGRGPQPPGGLQWRRERTDRPPLQGQTEVCVFTFTFSGGTQGPLDPSPDSPYYAVGFPREIAVPLSLAAGGTLATLLTHAWEQGKLFHIGISKTTGSEYVVKWAIPPLPPISSFSSLSDLNSRMLHTISLLQDLLHTPTTV